MAKDFCFMFYPGDYLRDTQCLSEAVQVAYDRIMCEHMRNLVVTSQQLKFFTKKLTEDETAELLMVLTVVDGGYQITWVAESITKRMAFTDSRRKSRLKSDEDNVRIYIVRDNVRSTYKIGSSVNPLRRYNELANQTNPAIMQDEKEARDITLIWYSKPVKRTEEKVLHDKFSEKNIVGEWFSLSKNDLKLIHKTYGGTYVKRTEDKEEDELENKKGNGNKKLIPDAEPLEMPWDSAEFAKAWDEWREYKLRQFGFKYALIKTENKALKRLFKISGGIEAKAIEAIDYSISNSWEGIFAEKEQPQPAKAPVAETVYRPAYKTQEPKPELPIGPELSEEEKAEKKRKADEAFNNFKKNFKAPAARTGGKSLRELLGTKQFEPEPEKISSTE